MPELTEAMYAHQQICIPPMFPYLLRQYAKAAIRSQPADLLKWSTAYFRSLAMNLKPPVKPRLEYPISKTHYGLTPGWLKTLLRQMTGYTMISWPLVVDRWHGACLEIFGLVQIILMGGFPDPSAIPWLRFIAVASGHLTQNLTSTMILICELLTEEPEGGSAMIRGSTFIDLYRFLAGIDAGVPHSVRNFFYTESNLSLTKREATAASTERLVSKEESVREESQIEAEIESERDTTVGLDFKDYLEQQTFPGGQSEMESAKEMSEVFEPGAVETTDVSKMDETESRKIELTEIPGEGGELAAANFDGNEPNPFNVDNVLAGNIEAHPSCFILMDAEVEKESREPSAKDESSEESTESSEQTPSVHSIEKSESMEEAVDMFIIKQAPSHTGETTSESSVESAGYTNILLPVVPGIGPPVPEDLVEAVVKYVREVANKQQGMIMPRNIRHFMCPPLEVMDL